MGNVVQTTSGILSLTNINLQNLQSYIYCNPPVYTGTAGKCVCGNGYAGTVSYNNGVPTGCTGIPCPSPAYVGAPAFCSCGAGYTGIPLYVNGTVSGCNPNPTTSPPGVPIQRTITGSGLITSTNAAGITQTIITYTQANSASNTVVINSISSGTLTGYAVNKSLIIYSYDSNNGYKTIWSTTSSKASMSITNYNVGLTLNNVNLVSGLYICVAIVGAGNHVSANLTVIITC